MSYLSGDKEWVDEVRLACKGKLLCVASNACNATLCAYHRNKWRQMG
ncbi:hypothetical protein H6F93_16250 [Leptolyngbya sp. FACHB-671]|nr:hypothetical protein [Leptolyngbya sp. FACHB-671]